MKTQEKILLLMCGGVFFKVNLLKVTKKLVGGYDTLSTCKSKCQKIEQNSS